MKLTTILCSIEDRKKERKVSTSLPRLEIDRLCILKTLNMDLAAEINYILEARQKMIKDRSYTEVKTVFTKMGKNSAVGSYSVPLEV